MEEAKIVFFLLQEPVCISHLQDQRPVTGLVNKIWSFHSD